MLKADLVIGNITKDNIEQNWFTEEMAQSILKQISDSASQEIKEQYVIKPNAISRLTVLINELTDLYRDEQNNLVKTKNDLKYYLTTKGWSEYLYQKSKSVSYEDILHKCVEILDILRTGNLENNLQLVVFETAQNDKSIIQKIYHGEEKNLSLSLYNGVEELHYLKSNLELKKEELSIDNSFVQHYQQLRNAISKRKSLQNLNEKLENGVLNEGHLIEAYQRHLYFQHNIKKITSETLSQKLDNERISSKWIAICVYYSMNNDPWWSGGDVGIMQIKGENTKLVTLMSVKAVASKILELVMHYNNFNVEDFKKLFTQGDLNNMIREDPKKLGNKTLKDILSEIGNKN